MVANVNSLIAATPKLNSDNYHDWKFNLTMILRRSRAWPVVSGAVPRPVVTDEDTATDEELAALLAWEGHSEEGLTAIGLSIEQSQVPYIRDCTSGPEAWAALAAIHERNGRAARIGLKRQLYTVAHDIEKPIRDYVNGITTLAAKLKAINIELTDVEVVDIIIYALHPDYNPVAATLMRSDDALTVSAVTSILVEAEEQYKKSEGLGSMTALAARVRNAGGSGPIVCHRCLQPGHIAKDCDGECVVRSTTPATSGTTPPPPPLRAARVALDSREEEEVLRLF